jgi:hypothetical protein
MVYKNKNKEHIKFLKIVYKYIKKKHYMVQDMYNINIIQ